MNCTNSISTGVRIIHSKFIGTKLNDSKLSSATFFYVDFSNAELENSQFTKTPFFQNVSFYNAKITMYGCLFHFRKCCLRNLKKKGLQGMLEDKNAYMHWRNLSVIGLLVFFIILVLGIFYNKYHVVLLFFTLFYIFLGLFNFLFRQTVLLYKGEL